MQASKLRQRITIQSRTIVPSPTGAPSGESVTDIATVWANIEPLSTRDVIQAKAAGSQATLRCTVRYRSDIDSTMQVRYDSKIYNIDGDPLADKKSGKEYMTMLLVTT